MSGPQVQWAALDDALLRLRPLVCGDATRYRDPEAGELDRSSVLIAHHLAASDQGLCIDDLAHLLGVAPSTASRLVRAAERTGLATRRPDAHDRRRSRLVATALGRAVSRRATAVRTSFLARLLADDTPADLETLTHTLTRLAAACAARPTTRRHST